MWDSLVILPSGRLIDHVSHIDARDRSFAHDGRADERPRSPAERLLRDDEIAAVRGVAVVGALLVRRSIHLVAATRNTRPVVPGVEVRARPGPADPGPPLRQPHLA